MQAVIVCGGCGARHYLAKEIYGNCELYVVCTNCEGRIHVIIDDDIIGLEYLSDIKTIQVFDDTKLKAPITVRVKGDKDMIVALDTTMNLFGIGEDTKTAINNLIKVLHQKRQNLLGLKNRLTLYQAEFQYLQNHLLS